MRSLVGDLLRCKSSTLCSSEYHLQLSFCQSGEAVITGLLWPDIMREINLKCIVDNKGEELKASKKKLVEDIDRTVATTTEPRILKSQFDIQDQDLNVLLAVIEKNQVLAGRDSPLVENPFWPSLMTIVQEVPDNLGNYQSSRSILKLVRHYLLTLSEEERNRMTTKELLENFWEEEVEEAVEVEEGIWKIVTPYQSLFFAVEEKFTEMANQFEDFPMAGLYHFSLSCAASDHDCEIILKRLHIKDCYTLPFNIMITKAFKSQTIIIPVCGTYSFDLPVIKETETDNPREPANDNDIPSHSELSLIEAISQLDKKIIVKSSRSFEFVPSGPERLLPVKRIDEWTESCYTVDGNDFTYFEEQRTMISRYFSRQNGSLVLAEFATQYQYPGEEKAKKIFHLYQDRPGDIPLTPSASVVSAEELPEFIITGFEDVMIKRTRHKVLKSSYFEPGSYEATFSDVLLFYYPLVSLDDMTPERVETLKDERCDDDREVSKVKRNRKQFIQNYRVEK